MTTPSETVQAAQPAFPHYFKALPPGCRHVDVYRVLQLFEVADPALQHAVKKLLCAGARGAKDQAQDVAEAIATLQRWQQMRAEEQDAADLGGAADQMREIMQPFYRSWAAALPAGLHGIALPAGAPVGDRGWVSCTGANEAHAVPTGEDAEAALKKAKRAAAHDLFAQFAKSDVQPVESGPMPEHPLPDPVAEGFRRKAEQAASTFPGPDPAKSHAMAQWLLAMESGQPIPSFDEWHAAYLARWANAPAEATHLAQDTGGSCNWFEREPVCDYDGQFERWSEGGRSWGAPTNSLGRVACEPRPGAEGER